MSEEKFIDAILRHKERMGGLTLEQRLAGLTPEQLRASLNIEERLAGLTPEERLVGLTPDELRRMRQLVYQLLDDGAKT